MTGSRLVNRNVVAGRGRTSMRLEPELFRIGASSMLADIERQLEHFVTGRYSATYRHPMA